MKAVLFDGVCNLCNASVTWIIDRDGKNQFKFASLQSEFGRKTIEKFKLEDDFMDTVLLIEDDKVFVRSDAALRILKLLGGIYSLGVLFFIVPRFVRDFVYNIIAANRYKWFGKSDTCRLPTPELKEKFLE